MNCYSCNHVALINVIYAPVEVWSCDKHFSELYNLFLKSRRKVNVNLGQVIDKWVKPDGTIGKITVGKDWEIRNRTISNDDGRSVVNKVNGKPPEY